MKLNFTRSMLTAAAMLLAASSQAVPYTAFQSGNFSSTSTWVGGVVPPSPLNVNDIIVNSGVVLTLDQNLVLNNTNSVLQLKGNARIESTSNHYIAINNGYLDGLAAASIGVDSVHYGSIPPAKMTFAGLIEVSGFSVSGATMPANVDVDVYRTLRIFGGASTLASGGAINIAASGTGMPAIVFDGGTLTATGTLGLSNTYDVVYKDASMSVGNGWELQGAGLRNMEFDPGGSAVISLNSNLNFTTGTLMFTSGSVDLNGNNLTIGGSATIDAAGTGTVSSSAASSISITSSAANIGTLRMHFSDHTVNSFTMNTGSNTAELIIGSDLIVATGLDLQSGKLNIQGYKLTMAGGAAINGGSPNSYIITETNGELVQSIAANATVLYPVGMSAAYAGMNVTSQNGTVYTDMGLNVQTSVLSHATTGYKMEDTQPLVNATWTITHATSTGLDYSVEPMWENALEVNSFDRANSAVVHHTNNDWDIAAATFGPATTSGGVNARKRDNITTLGEFAVFDVATASVDDVDISSNFKVYPNPADRRINIDLNTMQAAQVDIYSTTGQVVMSAQLQSGVNTLYIADLPAGMYFLQVSGETAQGSTKFIKR